MMDKSGRGSSNLVLNTSTNLESNQVLIGNPGEKLLHKNFSLSTAIRATSHAPKQTPAYVAPSTTARR